MPVLKARIGGAWVDVGGGADEVFVGPSDPIATAPGTELWYDTDEPAVLSSDTRWNTAWGLIGSAVINAAWAITSAGSWIDVPGMSVTWMPVVGRRYKLSASHMVFKSTANGDIYTRIVDAANAVYTATGTTMPVSYYASQSMDGVETGLPAVSQTRKLQAYTTSLGGQVSLTGYPAIITVEDIGPAVGAVPVPDPATPWVDVPVSGFVVAQGSSTNIGKTSTYAAYNRVGRSIRWQGTCVYTGTGTAAGNVQITLPVTARTAAVAGTRPIGSAIFYDQSANAYYKLFAVIASTGTMLFMPTGGTGATFFGATELTIAASDGLNWDVEYEAAS